MTLLTASGEKPDTAKRVDNVDAAKDAISAGHRPIIVPLALASAARDALDGERFALTVQNDAPVETIAPYLAVVDLIAVEFPAFSDGRGFSLAKRLRRAGFSGVLRASGPLIADQFADALACGFDEVEIPETMANRQPVQQWMAAKDSVSEHYQSGYGEGASILQKRLAARKGAAT